MSTTSILRAALAAAALNLAAPAGAADPGAAAPQFELAGRDGPVRLEAFRGKVVWVDFWASWCGPCKQSFPWMNEMQAKYGPKGFQIVAVNLDKKTADAQRFLAEVPADFPVAFDAAGAMPRAYGIKGMPTSVLIDAQGKVLMQHSGFRSNDREALERSIQAALGGRS